MPITSKLSTMPMPKKTAFLLLVLAFAAFALFVLFIKISQKPLMVVKTQPEKSAVDVSPHLKQVFLSFSRPLKNQDEIQVNFFPLIAFDPQFDKTKQTATLNLSQPLSQNETYIIEILSAKTGQTIYSFDFKTKKLDTEGLGDPDLVLKIQQKDQEDFPLLHWIPYEAPDFSVDYLSSKKLEVKIKTTEEKASLAVDAFIKSHGVDPKTHEIVFIKP